MTTSSGYLPVEGTSIHWELRRTHGPTILFVSAGMGIASAHEATAEILARRFRVVTYDRRGFARSGTDDKCYDTLDVSEVIPRNAQDAASIIRHHSPGRPVYIFGSCLGGAIVLQLLQTNPELVRKAIVHEPAVPLLVRDSEKQHILSVFRSLPQLLETFGAEVPSRATMALVMSELDTKDPGKLEILDLILKTAAKHMTTHYKHESKYAPVFRPDFNTLLAQKDKLALAIGVESTLPLQKDAAETIAAFLAIPLLRMPGSPFPFFSNRNRAIDRLLLESGESLQTSNVGLSRTLEVKL